MRFVGRGHPAIRATHDKTLEFARDQTITERATCVVAVEVDVEPLAAMAGRVRLRLAAGGATVSVDADANPGWDPAGPAVVRSSGLRLPGTFATNASMAAADLPRELVARLADPDALVTVDVAALPTSQDVTVLFLADPSRADDPALRAELAAADEVLPVDEPARRLAPATKRPVFARGPRRRLLVATSGLPARPAGNDEPVETVGLPPAWAAAAASRTSGPLTFVAPQTDARDALRSLPSTHRVVIVVAADRVDALRGLARDLRGAADCVLAQPFLAPVALADGDEPVLATREAVAVCLEAVVAGDGLDPQVRLAMLALLGADVPTKVVARALAELTGWTSRRAYDVALELRGR